MGVAIWTTVEVGIGITAGCVACLRPIVSLALGRMGIRSTDVGSTMGKLTKDKRAKDDAHIHTISLGGVHPQHGIVTTITGNNGQKSMNGYGKHSRSDSQEYLSPMPPMPGDITKFVVVETDEYDMCASNARSQEDMRRSPSPPMRR